MGQESCRQFLREKRLSAVANRAVRDGRGYRDACQIGSRPRSAVEVHHVAGFAGGYVDAENRAVRHAVQANDRAIKIGDCNRHARGGTDWQANHGACGVCCGDGIVDDRHYVRGGKTSKRACRGRDQHAFRRRALDSLMDLQRSFP